MYRTVAMRWSPVAWMPTVILVLMLSIGYPNSVSGTQQPEGTPLEGARNCHTFLTDAVPTGPRVTASRQLLQISYGDGAVELGMKVRKMEPAADS